MAPRARSATRVGDGLVVGVDAVVLVEERVGHDEVDPVVALQRGVACGGTLYHARAAHARASARAVGRVRRADTPSA